MRKPLRMSTIFSAPIPHDRYRNCGSRSNQPVGIAHHQHGIFFGTIFARLFQLIRIPQVVGYIFIGLLVGQSGLKFMDLQTVRDLQPFSSFALSITGFLIGGELHRNVFRKHGSRLITMLFGEGLGTFVFVFVLVGAIAVIITNSIAESVTYAVVLGVIASANIRPTRWLAVALQRVFAWHQLKSDTANDCADSGDCLPRDRYYRRARGRYYLGGTKGKLRLRRPDTLAGCL